MGMFGSLLLLKSIHLPPLRKLFFTSQKNPRTVATGQNSSSQNINNQNINPLQGSLIAPARLPQSREQRNLIDFAVNGYSINCGKSYATCDRQHLLMKHSLQPSHKAMGTTAPETCSAIHNKLKIGLLICLTTVSQSESLSIAFTFVTNTLFNLFLDLGLCIL
jgi:hypothetical protein